MAHCYMRNALAMVFGLILMGVCQSIGIAQEAKATGPDVTLTEDDASYTFTNGTVTAVVAKATGDLTSLQYKGLETINKDHPAAFTQTAAQGTGVTAKVTIDPKTTGGDRAEVSVKGTNITALNLDMEFRFCMGRGDSGIYTYCIYEHQPEYPGRSLGESRWVARVADYFNWTGEDHGTALTMREVPQELNGIRYTFVGSWFDHRSYGWASPDKKVGFWLINPSVEYIGCGPTKTDFLTHRDTNAAAPPCILLFQRPNHFGGGNWTTGQGEHWTKIVGPFFLYVNSGPDPQTMWKDAEAKAVKETAKWPFDWVKGVDYAHKDERTSVKGQVVLSDPMEPGAKMSRLLVGLSHPDYIPPAVTPGAGGRGARGRGPATAPDGAAPAGAARGARGARGAQPADGAAAAPPAGPVGPREVGWAQDAKYYQFWTEAQADGSFSIPNVIPGKYTLHAISDGVLGEFAKTDITVEAGKPIDLGKLTWTPVHYGKPLWEVGTPNRNGREFTYGDKYFEYESQLEYAKMFPNDVNYVIGQSNVKNDWFYLHMPHATDEAAPAARGGRGPGGNGRATPYNIRFTMPSTLSKGKATLRVAVCGGGGRIDVSVNDNQVGQINAQSSSDLISRHGIQGPWSERDVAFDASLLKQGSNVLTLTIPAGSINNGVIYDYVRLELDEAATN